MSTTPDGLQFPLQSNQQKPSSSKTGRAIIAAALANVNQHSAAQAQSEKNWRKQYTVHFKQLVEQGLSSPEASLKIAEDGLAQAHQTFEFYRDGQKHLLKDALTLPADQLHSFKLTGSSQAAPEWYVPYHGQKLQGDALVKQIERWENQGIMESSHANALRECVAHPEWFDLSDRTMVLFGAASEAGPLTWLAKWKANIVAIDLPSTRVWGKIVDTISQGNATLYAPCTEALAEDTPDDVLKEKLGANLLTQIPEIAKWLLQFEPDLDLAAIAYLDGEKHVRVSMAMDAIMK